MSNSEITAQDDAKEKLQEQKSEDAPPKSNIRDDTSGPESPGENPLSELTSAVSSTYSSFTSFLHKGVDGISAATMKLPSQVTKIAVGGTKMVSNITGNLADSFEKGLIGPDDDRQKEATPSFNELQEMFGLANSDSLIGSFVCELHQNYRPADNTFSPNIRMSFPVVVSVTEQMLCLIVEHAGTEYPGKIERSEILSVATDEKQITIKLTDDRIIILKTFGNSELKTFAHKLIRHLSNS